MPQFSYTAVDENNQPHKGVCEAENEVMARAELKKEGLFVTQIKMATAAAAGAQPKKKWTSLQLRELGIICSKYSKI